MAQTPKWPYSMLLMMLWHHLWKAYGIMLISYDWLLLYRYFIFVFGKDDIKNTNWCSLHTLLKIIVEASYWRTFSTIEGCSFNEVVFILKSISVTAIAEIWCVRISCIQLNANMNEQLSTAKWFFNKGCSKIIFASLDWRDNVIILNHATNIYIYILYVYTLHTA